MTKANEVALRVLERLRPGDWQRMLAWAALVGATGALATLGFRASLGWIEHWLYGTSGLVQAAESLPWWQRLLAPVIGGALAGSFLVLARRLPRAPHGDYMEATVLGRGQLPVRASLLRALSSACTVASGGAIGREGPMVQLAALTGSLLAGWRAMPVPRRRLLVACGAAAGLATAYGAPIAGALFIAEIVLQSLATETLAALLIASVSAHATVAVLVGAQPLYHMPALPPLGGQALLACGLLGLLAGLVAPLYLWLLDLSKKAFGALQVPLPLKLAVGGLIVGAISVYAPQVWGNGFSVVDSVLQGGWAWQALLVILALKIAAVAATTGSGAVGGIFTPTLFVGAVSGGLFAAATHALFPQLLPAPASAAIGMGAFLAASTHAPLTAVLMIFEMTESYGIVAPLMLASVLAFSVSRLLRPDSIYASSQKAKAATDPRIATAGDLLRPDSITVQAGDSLAVVEKRLLESRWRHVYVLDEHGVFRGAIALHDLTGVLKTPHDPASPWPASLLQPDYPRLRIDMPLWEVLGVFEAHPGERLPVLDASGRLAGHLAKTDLMLMLRDRLAIA
ncbi:ClcB-like voltage-gated chloride channel protein [Ramlibacter sp. G-1-2-2]|uniref:ClcB-like voltage-gated chloride channel protein n=1 Tax=Ramlibacter agri TaxID=2728837 RepID=A0A848H3X5_9BURK|nr:ClcB-like voltage-gated chloride channel protein [Ramlibacter agri]NML45274.1 ClcB-like voltage-gated chloride channel protein [Ramlibacter agri]